MPHSSSRSRTELNGVTEQACGNLAAIDDEGVPVNLVRDDSRWDAAHHGTRRNIAIHDCVRSNDRTASHGDTSK